MIIRNRLLPPLQSTMDPAVLELVRRVKADV